MMSPSCISPARDLGWRTSCITRVSQVQQSIRLMGIQILGDRRARVAALPSSRRRADLPLLLRGPNDAPLPLRSFRSLAKVTGHSLSPLPLLLLSPSPPCPHPQPRPLFVTSKSLRRTRALGCPCDVPLVSMLRRLFRSADCATGLPPGTGHGNRRCCRSPKGCEGCARSCVPHP